VNPIESCDSPALGSIRKPVLVIGGALDIESRRNAAEAIRPKTALRETRVVPDAGHLANLDNPQAYNALLLGFLEQHAGAPPAEAREPGEPRSWRFTTTVSHAWSGHTLNFVGAHSMVKVLVLYYSSYGHVEQMARAQPKALKGLLTRKSP